MGGAIPRTGASLGGAPLSLSRTPPVALAEHIARFFVTIIERPADSLLDDFLLHENAYVRVPLVGSWETLVDDRWVAYEGPPGSSLAVRPGAAVATPSRTFQVYDDREACAVSGSS